MANDDFRFHAFVLAVPDLDASAAYFRDALGFAREWRDGDNWEQLARGGVRVMLGHCPDSLAPAELGDHSSFAYLHVDDIDAVYSDLAGRGAIVMRPPADQPWGMREMAVATPDGHRLMIGQRLADA